MKPEAALYHWFSQRFVGQWCRIENAISSGMPDAAVLYSGQTFWVELKFGSHALLRPAQHVWMLNAWRQNVYVRVVHLYANNRLLAIHSGNIVREFDGNYWKIVSKPTLLVDKSIHNAQKIHDVLFSSSP